MVVGLLVMGLASATPAGAQAKTERIVTVSPWHDPTAPEPVPPFHLAYMQNFYVIGPGPAVDLLLHILERITLDANGEARGYVLQVSVECR